MEYWDVPETHLGIVAGDADLLSKGRRLLCPTVSPLSNSIALATALRPDMQLAKCLGEVNVGFFPQDREITVCAPTVEPPQKQRVTLCARVLGRLDRLAGIVRERATRADQRSDGMEVDQRPSIARPKSLAPQDVLRLSIQIREDIRLARSALLERSSDEQSSSVYRAVTRDAQRMSELHCVWHAAEVLVFGPALHAKSERDMVIMETEGGDRKRMRLMEGRSQRRSMDDPYADSTPPPPPLADSLPSFLSYSLPSALPPESFKLIATPDPKTWRAIHALLCRGARGLAANALDACLDQPEDTLPPQVEDLISQLAEHLKSPPVYVVGSADAAYEDARADWRARVVQYADEKKLRQKLEKGAKTTRDKDAAMAWLDPLLQTYLILAGDFAASLVAADSWPAAVCSIICNGAAQVAHWEVPGITRKVLAAWTGDPALPVDFDRALIRVFRGQWRPAVAELAAADAWGAACAARVGEACGAEEAEDEAFASGKRGREAARLTRGDGVSVADFAMRMAAENLASQPETIHLVPLYVPHLGTFAEGFAVEVLPRIPFHPPWTRDAPRKGTVPLSDLLSCFSVLDLPGLSAELQRTVCVRALRSGRVPEAIRHAVLARSKEHVRGSCTAALRVYASEHLGTPQGTARRSFFADLVTVLDEVPHETVAGSPDLCFLASWCNFARLRDSGRTAEAWAALAECTDVGTRGGLPAGFKATVLVEAVLLTEEAGAKVFGRMERLAVMSVLEEIVGDVEYEKRGKKTGEEVIWRVGVLTGEKWEKEWVGRVRRAVAGV